MTTHFPVRPSHDDPARSSWLTFLFFCFLAIVGFRIFLVERYGASIGWGDDIEGIAEKILGPLHRGVLDWRALFAPHNGDHVITATRLWEILWYSVNGDWDPKLVMTVKAPIYAGAMITFVHILTRHMGRGRFLAAGALTVLFAFPFNYHNLLWAFQSQFDFFLLTAALGWLALLNGRPVIALVCAAVAPFTLGAGPIVAASFIPFFVFGYFNGMWSMGRAGIFVVVAIAIAAFGASFATPDEALPRTGTLGDKAAMLVKLYAWPFSNLLSAVERLPESANLIPRSVLNFPSAESSWMLGLAELMNRFPLIVVAINLATAVVLNVTTLLLAVLALRRRISFPVALGALGVSVFVAAMLAATAIARTDDATIAIRFVDHVMLAGIVATVSAFVLAQYNRRWRPWLTLWALVVGLGYLATVGATLSQMVNRRKSQVSLEVLQRFYATNDPAVMRENEAFKLFIVSDDPSGFIRQLQGPNVRDVMPRAVIAPGAARGSAALLASAVGRWGLVIAFAAAAGAAWTALRGRRPDRYVSPVVMPGTPA